MTPVFCVTPTQNANDHLVIPITIPRSTRVVALYSIGIGIESGQFSCIWHKNCPDAVVSTGATAEEQEMIGCSWNVFEVKDRVKPLWLRALLRLWLRACGCVLRFVGLLERGRLLRRSWSRRVQVDVMPRGLRRFLRRALQPD